MEARTTGAKSSSAGEGILAAEPVIRETSPVTIEIDAQVTWESVATQVERGLTELSKTSHVKGFRPGKAPRTLLRQMYGGQLVSEAAGKAVQQAVVDIVRKHSLQPVAVPTIEPGDLHEGKPIPFTAKIEVRPKITRVDADGITAKRTAKAVENKDIDSEIENLQKRMSSLRPVQRAATDTDILGVSYTVTVGGDAREDLAVPSRAFDLTDKNLLPVFKENLTGARVGDVREVKFTLPDTDDREELRGKEMCLKVTINEVQERNLPELDDSFAKQVGPFETLLELRLEIRKQLESNATRQTDESIREQILDALVEKNPIAAPPSLVRDSMRAMTEEFMEVMRMMGNARPPTSPDFAKAMGVRAERQVKIGLLLSELARQESINVDDGEIDRHMGEIAQRTGRHIAKVRAEFQGERRDELRVQILDAKILEYLRARTTISDASA